MAISRIRTALIVVVSGWVVSSILPVRAQTISGTIAGIVKDQQGVFLSGVSILATNAATGRSYQGVTDEQGYYRIAEITPDVYSVQADFSGFQAERHVQVRVDVNRVTIEDFVLKISPETTVLEVSSQAPMTDTTGPTLSTYFTARQAGELPLLTRDVNNLALLAPGVSSVRTFSFASTLVPFSVGGSRGRDNNFIIDSVDNNEPLFGGAATQFTNPDLFAEYAILTGLAKAEFGRNSGATVNVITKSGSNKLHGTLFGFLQDDAFNARSGVEKAGLLKAATPFHEHIAGATLGGPLKKERAFFFISYQWDRAFNDLSRVYPVVNTLPTTDGLDTLRNLSATPGRDVLLNTTSVTQIPPAATPCFASVPPADPSARTTNPCFPPIAVRLAPGQPSVEYGTFLIPGANLFVVRDHQVSGRVDYRINNSNDFYGRYLVDDLRTPRSVLAAAGEVAFSDLGLLSDWRNIVRQRTQSLALNQRHYWVAALNELRFSLTRISQQAGAFGVSETSREGQASATVADTFGGFGAFAGNFPSAGTQFTLGRETRPSRTFSDIYQVQDNFSVQRGAHSFKFGADLVHTRARIRSMPFDLGQYFFGSAGIQGGLAAFLNETSAGPTGAFAVSQRFTNVLTDTEGNITGQGQGILPLREFDQALFVQDDFRLRPNFTLSIGLRHEHFGQPINSLALINPRVLFVPTDNNNLAPRLGFAWAPKGGTSTVIRGGYSVLYNPMPLNIPLLIWQSGPVSPLISTVTESYTKRFGTPTSVISSGTFPNPPLTLGDINVRVSGCSTFAERTTSGTVPLINCSNQDTVDRRLVNPYVQSVSLGVQRALNSNLLLEVGWVGNRGTKLFQRRAENTLGGWDSTCLASFGRSFSCLRDRPDNRHGGGTIVTNGGVSEYSALQVSLTNRAVHSRAGELALSAAYTWSHLIDNASEIFGPSVRFIQGNFVGSLLSPETQETVEAITPLPQDQNNLRAERGDSSFDRRHRLAVSYAWRLPSPQTGFARLIGGGWHLSGITTVQSGQPFTPLNGIPLGACADSNGDGVLTNDRPNIGNSQAPLNTLALLRDPQCIDPALGYVDQNGAPVDPNTARFVQVQLGGSGNAGRNILRGPGLVNFDFAVYRSFRSAGWREGLEIQLRAEVYDAFNRPNPGYALGNVFAADAAPTSGYAFSPRSTAAGATGVIPENTIDSISVAGHNDFLSQAFMNTASRRMQFSVRVIF